MPLSGLARAAVVASAFLHSTHLHSNLECFIWSMIVSPTTRIKQDHLGSESMQYRKEMVWNSSEGSQKLREILADSEGTIPAQSSLNKWNPLVRVKGGWQAPSN